MAKKKNPAAVELGRRGGSKQVPKGFSTMDPERRKQIAKEAIEKRWERERQKQTAATRKKTK